MQVRLAQNQYLLPRLAGHVGPPCLEPHGRRRRIALRRGRKPARGRTARMVRKRITSIKRELKQLTEVRAVQREGRYESGMFKVALAGYTQRRQVEPPQRGSPMRACSAYDKLFATLDSTTRKFVLPEGREITLTDTVGFIQKLPHHAASRRSNRRSTRSRALILILHVGGRVVRRARGADSAASKRCSGRSERTTSSACAVFNKMRSSRRGRKGGAVEQASRCDTRLGAQWSRHRRLW